MKQKQWKLPNKPSELIRVALKDLKLIENSKKYSVEMANWHQADEVNEDGNTVCEVCFAGSVMAKTLKVSYKKTLHPRDLSLRVSNKLQALNYFRCGMLNSGINYCPIHIQNKFRAKIGAEEIKENIEVEDYHNDPKQFRKDMFKIIGMFEKVGL